MIKSIFFLTFLLIHLASASCHDSPPNGSSDLESAESILHLSTAAPTSYSKYGGSSYVQQPHYVLQANEATRLTPKAAKLQALMMLKQAKLGGLLLKELAKSQAPKHKLTVSHIPVSVPVLKLVKVPAQPVVPVLIKPAEIYPAVVKPPVIGTSYLRPQPAY